MIAFLFALVGCAVSANDQVAEPAVSELAPPPAEKHTVPTSDGAAVVLNRRQADGPPVIIVHGISSNHHCWDLTPERSLAVYLQEQGFDAWLLDLRGHGDATLDASGKRQWAGWSIDHYGRHDVPAAVDYVLEQTGAERVGYVGHSLGGMVGAIYAGTQPGANEKLSALVAVGSPMDFSDPDPVVWSALTTAGFTWIPVIPSDLGGKVVALLDGETHTRVDTWAQDLLFTDIRQDLIGEMYSRVASPLTKGELKQLSLVTREGVFVDAAGEVDYVEALGNVQVPTLVFSGRGDQIAPVDRVYAYYEASGAEKKRFVVAGRAHGFAADYGHLDLPLGDHAREEIYPLIGDWLRESSP